MAGFETGRERDAAAIASPTFRSGVTLGDGSRAAVGGLDFCAVKVRTRFSCHSTRHAAPRVLAVDNAGHDAIAGARRWRVRSPARRFCGVPPERWPPAQFLDRAESARCGLPPLPTPPAGPAFGAPPVGGGA